MKRILLLLVLCLNISMVLGQEYKNWEKYDIEGFYIIAKSKAEAKISKNVLREGADYYILTEMDDQVFPSVPHNYKVDRCHQTLRFLSE
jgi:hypothetical protein